MLKENENLYSDPHTVRFNLYRPTASSGQLGSASGKIIQRGADFSKADAGTGPFKGAQLLRAVRASRLSAMTTTGGDGRPYLDGITGVAGDRRRLQGRVGDHRRHRLLRSGDFQHDQDLQAAKNTSYLLSSSASHMSWESTAPSTLQRSERRQAMKMLINRKEYVELVAEGWGTPTPDTSSTRRIHSFPRPQAARV